MEKGWRTILGADSMNVILVTKDPRAKVIEWYRSTLEANGWKIASGNEHDMRLAARNDKREYVNISTTETANKSCRIAVILIKN
jgi:hypothetical protein